MSDEIKNPNAEDEYQPDLMKSRTRIPRTRNISPT